MKLFALIAALLLIAASGTGVLLAYHKILNAVDSPALQFGLWLLVIVHVVAAGLLTSQYIDNRDAK